MDIKPIPELEKLKIRYYYMSEPLFEMVKQMRYRESVFLSMNTSQSHRCLKINAVKYLQMNFLRYKFFDGITCYNIYSSVAHVPDMPMFSFSPEKKLEEQALFNIDHKEMMRGYDLIIDIDNEDLDKAYSDTVAVKALFDDYKVAYSINFSGKKGFHVRVLEEDQPKSFREMKPYDKAAMFRLFAHELKLSMNLHSIDTGIYDTRRIAKTPYSVVYPYYYVALPLTDEQFKDFKLSTVFLPDVIQQARTYRDRGLCTRQGDHENLCRLFSFVSHKSSIRARFYKKFRIERDLLAQYEHIFKRVVQNVESESTESVL